MARRNQQRSRRPPRPPLSPPSPVPLGRRVWERIRHLFRAVKIPGWVLLLIAVADWKSRYDFFADEARSVGGNLAMLSHLSELPTIRIAVFFAGVFYLIFVGDPIKNKVINTILVCMGWFASIAILVCALVIFTAGYTMYKFGPRTLNPTQREDFISALSQNHKAQYRVMIEQDITCPDCETFGRVLEKAIDESPGWTAEGNGSVAGPSFDADGIALYVRDPNALSEDEILLENAFKAAHIHFEVNPNPSRQEIPEIIVMPVAPKS